MREEPARDDVATERPQAASFGAPRRSLAARILSGLAGAYRRVAKRSLPVRRGARPRIAIVAPHAPDPSAPAHFVLHALPEIGRHADIDLYTDAPPGPLGAGVRFAGRVTPLPYLRDYDRVVSLVANAPSNARILSYVRDYGGACLLHDNRLLELYQATLGRKRFLRFAARSLGRAVTQEDVGTWLEHPRMAAASFLEDIVHAARPLVVSSQGLAEAIRARYGADPVPLAPCCRTFPDAALSEASRAAARRRLAIEPGRVVVASFGAVTPSHAAMESIWALEQLRAWHIDAALHFVGEPSPHAEKLRVLAAELDLTPFIHFPRGGVTEAAYSDYLLAADAAIQLRTDGLGIVSGGLLDAIACGLPVVANVGLAAAADAPASVRRVPDNISPILVAEQVAQLVAEGRRTGLDDETAAYLRQHSPALYAERFLAILGIGRNAPPGPG